MQAAVIGAGAWGTTLAKVLAENIPDVVIWSHDAKIAAEINEQHENVSLFSGVPLPPAIRATADLAEAVDGARLILLVVASAFYGQTVDSLGALLPAANSAGGGIHDNNDGRPILVSATKGLDPATNRRTSEILAERLPPAYRDRFAILSGPNISREIAAGKPATTVIASTNKAVSGEAQKYFSTPYFRVYTNTDVTGTELGGTLKNIIAIAAGIVDGLELGDNTRSALMVRALVEIIRFGTHFGAQAETFYGLAGMGDLITTCSSVLSRNHYVGEHLAKGQSADEILGGMTAVAEGVETTRLIRGIAVEAGIDMPVTEQVYQILFENKPVKMAIHDLMTRDLKAEQR
ncbi:MAG: NAD(P)-dependent glycerol-3-phosphate dehydrogenase [bacterium]|nr:NAD(P)-dependent glycerol-3-phosphate dehydrogenase [bacterium]